MKIISCKLEYDEITESDTEFISVHDGDFPRKFRFQFLCLSCGQSIVTDVENSQLRFPYIIHKVDNVTNFV